MIIVIFFSKFFFFFFFFFFNNYNRLKRFLNFIQELFRIIFLAIIIYFIEE